MPTPVTQTLYRCEHCGKVYPTEKGTIDCEMSHDLIVIKLERRQLKAITSFAITGNPDYITPDIVEILQRYNKIVGGKL